LATTECPYTYPSERVWGRSFGELWDRCLDRRGLPRRTGNSNEIYDEMIKLQCGHLKPVKIRGMWHFAVNLPSGVHYIETNVCRLQDIDLCDWLWLACSNAEAIDDFGQEASVEIEFDDPVDFYATIPEVLN